MEKAWENMEARSEEAGVTLIETMISLLAMGIVFISLGQGLTLGIRMNTEAKSRIANLNVCKRITEKLKSDIQFSQAAFDGAESNTSYNRTYSVDSYGVEIPANQTGTAPSFNITTVVGDYTDSGGNTLTATDSGGVSHVLVKSLSVTVTPVQSAVTSNTSSALSSRKTNLVVEMVRPAS